MTSFSCVSTNSSCTSSCSICLEDLNPTNMDAVAHEGLGKGHPMHKECIKTWIKIRSTCPVCAAPVDQRSLFSPRERVILELTHAVEDARKGLVKASIAGVVGSIGGAVAGELTSQSFSYYVSYGLSLHLLKTITTLPEQRQTSILPYITRLALTSFAFLSIHAASSAHPALTTLVAVGAVGTAAVIQGLIDRKWFSY